MDNLDSLIHFYDEPILPIFKIPPAREKSPPCPDGFIWREKEYAITALLSEWHDYRRRGRMGRNMQPAHAQVAASRGSLGVGRFYFCVQVENGCIFEIYYDRAIASVTDRKGHWFLFGERAPLPKTGS